MMIEFTTLQSNKRITFDVKDIRAIVEQNEGTKILFYYDLKLVELVAEDYENVFKRIDYFKKRL
jgi:hypothetical protein